MIDVRDLTKSYVKDAATTPVLRGVSFSMAAGEFAAVMGPSGSGKSTLLNILGYLDRPDAGSYRLDGESLDDADDDRLSSVRNRKIGFVFQQFHLLQRVSAQRNVMLPLLYADEDANDGEARALRALRAVGLEERAHHTPAELSGGEQQRVAIARALINDPRLILADEPTGNLDERNADEVMEILRGLAAEGRTIVLVTHDRAIAERTDRLLTLAQGRIASDEAIGVRVMPPGAAAAAAPSGADRV